METKFTPGPWKAGPEHMEGLGQAVRSDSHVVAYCQTRMANGRVWHNERKANASLIAAAPDLYEALYAILNSVHCSIPSMDLTRQALAALAAARGEQP